MPKKVHTSWQNNEFTHGVILFETVGHKLKSELENQNLFTGLVFTLATLHHFNHMFYITINW